MLNITPSALEAAIPLLAGVVAVLIGLSRTTGSSTSIAERAKTGLRWMGPALIAFGLFLLLMSRTHEPANARKIVNGMKAKLSLPVQVDDDTRLDDVRALTDTEIGYFLTLTRTTKAQLQASPIAQRLQNHILGSACQNPDYEKLLTSGISLTLRYATTDDTEITRVVVTPSDCNF